MAPTLIETVENLPTTHQLKNDKSGIDSTRHSNPSLQVTADHSIEMAEAPIEKPGPGDVLIHVRASGICG